MLTMKSAAHVRTGGQRASFRACPSSTGIPAWRAEAGRRLRERIGLANRQARRSWLEERWAAHRRRLERRERP